MLKPWARLTDLRQAWTCRPLTAAQGHLGAQLDEGLIVAFGSDHNLRVSGSSPALIGLGAHGESA